MPDERGEAGVVADPVPRRSDLEENEAGRSLGEGGLEARERLLALSSLRMQAGEVERGDITCLGQGLEIVESAAAPPRPRRARSPSRCAPWPARSRPLLSRKLVGLPEGVDRPAQVAPALQHSAQAEQRQADRRARPRRWPGSSRSPPRAVRRVRGSRPSSFGSSRSPGSTRRAFSTSATASSVRPRAQSDNGITRHCSPMKIRGSALSSRCSRSVPAQSQSK